ncbi:hypothetical protein B188_24550 [Candidatus Brocadiaceae bacterium B188]|nr:hypothetical protein B188_24550 [Candidatus Brocadiaceae bacterium B188]
MLTERLSGLMPKTHNDNLFAVNIQESSPCIHTFPGLMFLFIAIMHYN